MGDADQDHRLYLVSLNEVDSHDRKESDNTFQGKFFTNGMKCRFITFNIVLKLGVRNAPEPKRSA